MKKVRILFQILVFTLASGSLTAKAKLESLKFRKLNDKEAEFSVAYKGSLGTIPDLTIRDSLIQLEVPNTVVWPKLEKKVSLVDGSLDTTLMAYQFDKNLSRLRALLPFRVAGHEKKIEYRVDKDRIYVKFPILNGKEEARSDIGAFWKKGKKGKANVEQYDESYLDKLLKEKKKVEPEKDKVQLDSVKLKQASSSTESKFSIAKYVAKFVAFLGLILIGFYFVVSLFKKGVIKKGRLGFLHNSKMVSVLSTTHIAPKRNLMLVKAHNQVFLIGNSEKGISLISELNDTTGLIKESEKIVSGSNFDKALAEGESVDKEFRLKDFDNNEKEAYENDSPEKAHKKESLSDQIKTKVKSLKPLQ